MPFFKLMYNFKLHGFNKKSIICIFANLLKKITPITVSKQLNVYT